MYLVIFSDSYSDYIDEYSKLFNSLEKAREYKNKLNQEIAETSNCSIKDIGDYYYIAEIQVED